jgi:xanthosine utilization system XapX-like protein
MRSYLASLVLGVAVGVIYGLVKCGLRRRPRSHCSASSVCLLVSRPYRLLHHMYSKAMFSRARCAIVVKRPRLTTSVAAKETDVAFG